MTAQTQPEALRVAAWLINAPQRTTIGDMLIAGRELRHLHARIAELESEVTTKTKQINALQLLQSSQMARMLDLQDQVAPAKEAIATLQSERDANARLTQEIEQLREKRQPLSDEQIEVIATSSGARWRDDSHWIIEDADLHPMARMFAAHNITGEPA